MQLRTIAIIYIFIFGNLLGQNIIFEDGFESGSLDSTTNGWWTIEASDTNYFIETILDGSARHSGLYGVAIGSNRNGAYTTNALDLHLDLSNEEQVELSFWIKNQGDDTDVLDGIWFSDDDGQNFKIIYPFNSSDWANQYGQLPPIDIDALAKSNGLNLTNQFVIRFQQYGYWKFGSDGYFIDDVKVERTIIDYATVPFFDDFESGTLNNSWKFANPLFPNATTTENTVVPSGFVKVTQTLDNEPAAYKGSFGLAVGKSANGGSYGTTAFDLHLDLSSEEQIELSFWIKNQGDDTDVLDGIWLSDDGGQNFEIVYPFNTSDWANQYGQLPPIDIDALAKSKGLSLTNKFVIRFQQYGYWEFGSHGFFIDDVKVERTIIDYATLPFFDDFESSSLNNSWKWSDPTFPSLTTVSPTEAITVIPGGFASVAQAVDNIPTSYQGSFGLAIGQKTNGHYGTNALDLHLNLTEFEDIILSFWIKDYSDQTQPYDGIWFSDDGGEHFSPAATYRFDPSNWSNDYHNIIVNVDSIINARIDLSFSDQFVIRFQHYGYWKFGSDGFSFDDVNVFGSKITDVETNTFELPTTFILEQNYPNPFNPSTTISYSLPKEVTVNITVYDLFGREVAVLVNKEKKSAGTYQVTFNSPNVASGIYMYRLKTENYTATKKMLLVQ